MLTGIVNTTNILLLLKLSNKKCKRYDQGDDKIRVKKWVTHFLDKGNDLYFLDTKTVMDPTVVYEVQSIATCGKVCVISLFRRGS